MNTHCATRLPEGTPLSPTHAPVRVAARLPFVLHCSDDAGAPAQLAVPGRLLLAPAGERAAAPAESVVRYDGFGNRIAEASDDLLRCDGSAAVSLSWRDPPQEQDADPDWLYNRARWYDPSPGRWLAEAPLRYAADDLNLCRYVRSHSSQLPAPDADTPQP
jgi:RHS repeat-associated protein